MDTPVVEPSRPEPRRSAAEQQRHMAVLARPKMPKTDWMEEMESTEGTGKFRILANIFLEKCQIH